MKQFQNKKYFYEIAKESDGEEISQLLEQADFDGDISLVYRKRPNAILSISKDCEKSAIVVGRECSTKKIKGVGICSINKMKCSGFVEDIAYLGGLRIDKSSTLNIIESYKFLELFVKENNVKYTYTTILEDNVYTQKMLSKKRKLMPYYIKIADYTVNIIGKNLFSFSKNKCQKATISDLEELKNFIERESKDKMFFPYLNLDNNFFGLSFDDFYVLKNENNEIIACGILWDQCDYKQLLLKRYSKKYKIIKKLTSFLGKLLKFPKFPEENEVIKYETLSFLLYKDNDINILNDFLKQISHKIKYSFFVFGTTQKIKFKFPTFKYKSFVYIVDWDKNFDTSVLNNSDIYIECALL